MQFFNNADRIEKDAEKQIKVQKAKNKAISALSHLELERLQNEKLLQPEREEITRLKCETESKNKLQRKSWSYKVSALLLACISVLMSVSGISDQRNILALGNAFTSENGVFAISIFILQCVMLGFSFWGYEIQENHYRTYNKIKLFQLAIVSVSIYCNFQYMKLLVPNAPVICAVFACAFDVGSIYFSELATVTKYRLYSKNTSAEHRSRFEKFFALASDKLFGWIDKCYNEKFGQKTVANNDKMGISLTDRLLEKIEQAPSETVITKSFLGLENKPLEWREIKDIAKDKGLCRATNNKFIRN